MVGHRRDDVGGAVDGGDLLCLDARQGVRVAEVVGDLSASPRVLLVFPGGGCAGSQRDPDVLVLGRPLGSHDELLDAGGLAAGGINRGLGIAVVVGVLQVREWAVGVLVDLHLGEGETGHLADQELGGQVGFGCCRVPG